LRQFVFVILFAESDELFSAGTRNELQLVEKLLRCLQEVSGFAVHSLFGTFGLSFDDVCCRNFDVTEFKFYHFIVGLLGHWRKLGCE
jgi:hypothetical protein